MSLEADPIRRRKLSDEVRERLLAQINEGDLRPGDALRPSASSWSATAWAAPPSARRCSSSPPWA
jgi:hypothetical protein